MLEGPFAEQNSGEVELKEFVEPALMGLVLHFLYFKNGEHFETRGNFFMPKVLRIHVPKVLRIHVPKVLRIHAPKVKRMIPKMLRRQEASVSFLILTFSMANHRHRRHSGIVAGRVHN